MTQIISYLTFNGNCREAMTFYKECLGGELHFQTVGDSPLSEQMTQKMKDCILQAKLVREQLILLGTDLVADSGLIKGNSVSLSLHCSSENEIRSIYRDLSKGGIQNQKLTFNFWGDLSGELTDRFGNHWLLNLKN